MFIVQVVSHFLNFISKLVESVLSSRLEEPLVDEVHDDRAVLWLGAGDWGHIRGGGSAPCWRLGEHVAEGLGSIADPRGGVAKVTQHGVHEEEKEGKGENSAHLQ